MAKSPSGASRGAELIELDEQVLRRMPLPVPDGGDKEERGRVLIVAGSREIPGAAVLAATAALQAGAGKVAIATAASIAQAMAFAVPESRVIALPETGKGGIAPDAAAALEEFVDNVKVVLVGPGLLSDASTTDLAASLLGMFSSAAIILDAGAMSVVKTRGEPFASPVLMTPHAGEMASLTGMEKDAVQADPVTAALDGARTWNAVVALKGAITHIATPVGGGWRHQGGNYGLATSGSGDVLAGIIAGLIARGTPLAEASAWGVALHARAGSRLAERFGSIGYLARELAGELPALMAALAG